MAADSGPARVQLMRLAAERIVIVSSVLSVEPRVPVTARLSKRFYDLLGEDIANELVDWFNAVDLTPRFARGELYRTDLRGLNELNFDPLRREAGAARCRVSD